MAKDDFLEIGSKTKMLGTIIAPDAWVELKKKARFRGAICAENVIVGSKVVALHHGASSSLPKVAPDDEADEDDETVVAAIPTEFALGQNYPNPFNLSTTISFALPKAGEGHPVDLQPARPVGADAGFQAVCGGSAQGGLGRQ